MAIQNYSPLTGATWQLTSPNEPPPRLAVFSSILNPHLCDLPITFWNTLSCPAWLRDARAQAVSWYPGERFIQRSRMVLSERVGSD